MAVTPDSGEPIEDVPDLGPAPQRLMVDVETVCHLAIAWTLLTGPGRDLLRERLDIEDSTWTRGRGWALWKSLSHLANALEDDDVASEAEARQIVSAILDDYRAAR